MTATLSPATFDPVPVVAIDGVDVASGAADPSSTLMVVDGFRIRWGRDDVLDQPAPATGTLTLFDTSRTWATTTDRRGQPVTLRYEGTVTAGSFAGFQSAVFFRGRIGSPVTVRRKTVVHPVTGERVRGALITIPLVSILLDAANNLPTAAWPAETMGARFDRLKALLEAAGTLLTGSGSAMRAFWRTPNVAPVAAKDQRPLLDQLTDVYDSSGADKMIYNPDGQAVFNLVRRSFTDAVVHRGVAGLWWDGTSALLPRGDQGAYIRSYGLTPLGGTGAGLPVYLDTASIEYDPADGITTPDRITRVAITHPDEAAAYASVTEERAVAGTPANTGYRQAKIDSLVAWNSWAAVGLSDLESVAQYEGSAWVLEPLTLTTRRLGGFETYEIARTLLSGYERNTIIFLQRSWLPQFGIRPVYGVMGGTIGYSDGGWDVEFSLSPIITTQKQHAISWSEIDDGSATYELQWWDDDHPRGLHESLTYEDVGYCATGLNVTTIPPDTGWDTL